MPVNNPFALTVDQALAKSLVDGYNLAVANAAAAARRNAKLLSDQPDGGDSLPVRLVPQATSYMSCSIR